MKMATVKPSQSPHTIHFLQEWRGGYNYVVSQVLRLVEGGCLAGSCSPTVLPIVMRVPSLSPIIDNSSDFVVWRKRYVREQPLSKGFFYFVVPFVHGNNSPYVFARLADFAEQFGDDVFRFTPRQNFADS